MLRCKHWIKFIFRISRLYLQKQNDLKKLTTQSYDKISPIYDEKWSDHMNKFSDEMIRRMIFPRSGKGIDLTCGTGYVTNLIAKRLTGEVIGVDISEGMLMVARKKYGDKCRFVRQDVLDFLREQPSESIDIVTCAWGLGFTKPYSMIKEISRVLKSNGQLAVIDNSLFTIYEVVFSGLSTVAERPASVIHVMNVRWLPTKGALRKRMRLAGLQVVSSWKGKKTYYASNEKDAINFLISTGTAAGYQYCIDPRYADVIKQRFGVILKKSYGTKNGIPITHRYIAAIAKKP